MFVSIEYLCKAIRVIHREAALPLATLTLSNCLLRAGGGRVYDACQTSKVSAVPDHTSRETTKLTLVGGREEKIVGMTGAPSSVLDEVITTTVVNKRECFPYMPLTMPTHQTYAVLSDVAKVEVHSVESCLTWNESDGGTWNHVGLPTWSATVLTRAVVVLIGERCERQLASG